MQGLKNKWFLLFVGFFVFHAISGLLSHNKPEGLIAIEVKLSFLAFPYFLFLFKWDGVIIKRILGAFVSGVLFAFLACVIRAVYIYFTKGSNYFFYNDFSYFIHAGYFSMYLLTAIVITALAYPVWFGSDKMNTPIRFLFLVIFIAGIFLCASKAGLIAFMITSILAIGYKYRNRINLKKVSVGLAGVIILLFVIYKIIPEPFERLIYSFKVVSEGNIDKTTGESTGVRILIWEQCMELVKENFLAGTSVGDANDALHVKYEANGLTGALAHNLNTHNQYFQTFIGLGVFGFLMLVAMTLGTMILGLLKRNIFLTLFSLIIIINFLVESMLQTQAGTLFYAFFICLFIRYDPLDITES